MSECPGDFATEGEGWRTCRRFVVRIRNVPTTGSVDKGT
jgi:hypothetical protein